MNPRAKAVAIFPAPKKPIVRSSDMCRILEGRHCGVERENNQSANVSRSGSSACAAPSRGFPAPTSHRATGVCGQTGPLCATTQTSLLAFPFRIPKYVQTEVRYEIAALNLPSVAAEKHLLFSAAFQFIQ